MPRPWPSGCRGRSPSISSCNQARRRPTGDVTVRLGRYNFPLYEQFPAGLQRPTGLLGWVASGPTQEAAEAGAVNSSISIRIAASAIPHGTRKTDRHWNLSSFLNLSITNPANCVPRNSPMPVVRAK